MTFTVPNTLSTSSSANITAAPVTTTPHNSLPPNPKRSSHHKRRSSVSTRHESAEIMGVSMPDLPISLSSLSSMSSMSSSDENAEKDSIRRRALWALEGKPDAGVLSSYSKVEIPDVLDEEKQAQDGSFDFRMFFFSVFDPCPNLLVLLFCSDETLFPSRRRTCSQYEHDEQQTGFVQGVVCKGHTWHSRRGGRRGGRLAQETTRFYPSIETLRAIDAHDPCLPFVFEGFISSSFQPAKASELEFGPEPPTPLVDSGEPGRCDQSRSADTSSYPHPSWP